MGEWTISVVKVPIAGINGLFYHNAIVIRDGNGNYYAEYNGAPYNPDPQIENFIDPRNVLPILSGQLQVGALAGNDFNVGFAKHGVGQPIEVFRGTEDDIIDRMQLMDRVVDQINDRADRYIVGGVGDVNTGTEKVPGYNSNSVATNLLEVIGVNPFDSRIHNLQTPGSGNP
jgi:hypothetical protein